MDDLTQKLQSLLSDPESLRNLSELAAMLRQPDSEAEPAGQRTEPMPEESAAPPVDLTKLMAVGQALSRMQQDDSVQLLTALKPHLSAERAKRADKAVRMLRLYHAAGVLRENGLLQDFFGEQ
ncbi:MAG: hypothetical protein IKI58_10785 [Oscillospiraceae bacterium]|nr:hypothetical protein [Oscillospiraceae bacterium]